MSESGGATNQPGSVSQNASAADGQVPGSSARIDSPPAHNAQSDDDIQVCVHISKVRTDSTITHRIGLDKEGEGGLTWENAKTLQVNIAILLCFSPCSPDR